MHISSRTDCYCPSRTDCYCPSLTNRRDECIYIFTNWLLMPSLTPISWRMKLNLYTNWLLLLFSISWRTYIYIHELIATTLSNSSNFVTNIYSYIHVLFRDEYIRIYSRTGYYSAFSDCSHTLVAAAGRRSAKSTCNTCLATQWTE